MVFLEFIENYSVEEDLSVPQSRFESDPRLVLTVPALDELWAQLGEQSSRFGCRSRSVAESSSKARRHGTESPSSCRIQSHRIIPLVLQEWSRASTRDIRHSASSRPCSQSMTLIENPRQGMAMGKPQVLVNRNRAARNRWRLKALLDPDGRPVKNNFLIVRPKDSRAPALFLWAILNSPIANAFVARDTMKRDKRGERAG